MTIGAPTGDADISINKTVNNSNPNPNGSITYTITVSNNGPDNLTTLTVFDDLPTSSVFTYVSHSGAGATYSGGNITWNVGALNNGQSKTLTVTGNALQDHQNCAVIQSASLPDSNSSNNEACANTDVNEPPPTTSNVSVTKIADTEAPALNTNFTYTILVYNSYPAATTTALNITDQLPLGITYISSFTSHGSYNPGNGIWSIGALQEGAEAYLTIVAKATTIGVKNNCANITTITPTDSNTSDNTSCWSVNAGAVDLEVSKTAVGGAGALSNTNKTFNITLYNNSGNSASGVTVEELVPAGWTYVSHSAPSGTSYNASTRIWNIGAIEGAETKTLSLVLKAPIVGSNQTYTNCADLKTAIPNEDIDSTPGNNQTGEDDKSCIIGTIYSAIPDLKLTKTVTPASPISIGTPVTFAITVMNEGNASATNIVVADQLPSGFSLTSGNASTTIPVIAPGASVTINLIGSLNQSGQNCAQIQSMAEPDLDSVPGNGYNNSEDDKNCVTYQVINPVCNLATNAITNGGFESLDMSSSTYALFGSIAKNLPLAPSSNGGWSYAGPIAGGTARGVQQSGGNGDPWDGTKFGYLQGENACFQPGNASATPKRFAVTANTNYITCINAASYNNPPSYQTATPFKVEILFYESASGGSPVINAWDYSTPPNTGGWNNLNWGTYCQSFSAPEGYDYAEIYYTVTSAQNDEGLVMKTLLLKLWLPTIVAPMQQV